MEHPKTVVGTFPKEMETRMAPRLNGIPAHLTLNKTWNTAILFLLDEKNNMVILFLFMSGTNRRSGILREKLL